MAGGQEVTISYQLHSSSAIAVLIVVFISIAFYNVLELLTLTFTTFRKYTGLYFWSFLISTCGIAFNGTGYLLKHLSLTTKADLYATLILIGWCTMISGQSLVLYSRLHLVLQNRKWLRAVLTMIIVDAVWLHIPVIVLVYGSNSSTPGPFLQPYSIFEKLQLTVFFVQECIISAIYVWKTSKFLHLEKTIGNAKTRRVMSHLVCVNVIIILLDITILVLEYTGNYDIQTAWKPLVYSVKLKIEFSILNKLRDLVGRPAAGSYYHHSSTHQPRGVALETFSGGKLQTRRDNQDFETGYAAHVGKGDASARFKNTGVLKTTEITIHTDERRRESDTDSVSPDRKSSMTGEFAVADGREVGCTSTASSEVQFARARA